MAFGLPNKVVNDSAASRNSVVEIPLSLAASTGTSAKDFWIVSNQVDMMFIWDEKSKNKMKRSKLYR